MRPASDRARIGVIGTGWWATYAHLPSLTRYERAEVVAIADPSPERLSLAGEHFGIAAQYADYHAMLDRGDLDGVVVATPHATHYAVASDVLRRGIPIMLEAAYRSAAERRVVSVDELSARDSTALPGR